MEEIDDPPWEQLVFFSLSTPSNAKQPHSAFYAMEKEQETRD